MTTEKVANRRYRKKPVVVEAVQYEGANRAEINEFVGDAYDFEAPFVLIRTLEGTMRADVGDWIIRGVNGEFYPCKPDIFGLTYEAVE